MANPKRPPTGGPGRKVRTSRVLYRGRTWAVTSHGIERHAGYPYTIEKKRLLERRDHLLDWPLHIADKGGDYDFEDFALCYVRALQLFGLEVPCDTVRDSIAAALAEHTQQVGSLLRDLYREPANKPFRDQFGGSVSSYFADDIRLELDWEADWDKPDPTLVAAAARRQRDTKVPP